MDNCVCCPLGKVVDKLDFGRRRTKAKTSRVECGGKREGRAREHCSFFKIHIINSILSGKNDWDLNDKSPDFLFKSTLS